MITDYISFLILLHSSIVCDCFDSPILSTVFNLFIQSFIYWNLPFFKGSSPSQSPWSVWTWMGCNPSLGAHLSQGASLFCFPLPNSLLSGFVFSLCPGFTDALSLKKSKGGIFYASESVLFYPPIWLTIWLVIKFCFLKQFFSSGTQRHCSIVCLKWILNSTSTQKTFQTLL